VAKAQALVNESQSFIARNHKKLDSGSLNHKDTLAITEEMSALVIRVSRFEDDLLEVMESQEACQTAHKQIEQAITDLEGDLAAATQERDDALAAIVAQGRAVVGRRDAEVRGIDAALLKRYDTIRSRLGGVGAVRLWGGRCEGCQMELPPGDLDKISRTAPDQVVLCEECGRILVRVPQ
jgi:predicted  nucleic acid-binding Zn-ribbon protein